MSNRNPWAMGAVEFVQTAASRRAATYRERAAQFVEMAEGEPIGTIRNQLLALAARYEELAAGLEPSRATARNAYRAILNAPNWRG